MERRGLLFAEHLLCVGLNKLNIHDISEGSWSSMRRNTTSTRRQGTLLWMPPYSTWSEPKWTWVAGLLVPLALRVAGRGLATFSYGPQSVPTPHRELTKGGADCLGLYFLAL